METKQNILFACSDIVNHSFKKRIRNYKKKKEKKIIIIIIVYIHI